MLEVRKRALSGRTMCVHVHTDFCLPLATLKLRELEAFLMHILNRKEAEVLLQCKPPFSSALL